MLIFQEDFRLEKVTEPLHFGFNPFSDQGAGRAEQVELDNGLRVSGGRAPDSLHRTVDQDDRRDPSLRAEDLTFVGLGEHWLKIARYPDRIGIK